MLIIPSSFFVCSIITLFLELSYLNIHLYNNLWDNKKFIKKMRYWHKNKKLYTNVIFPSKIKNYTKFESIIQVQIKPTLFSEPPLHYRIHKDTRGGKKIRARGYPRIKSVMGTGRVVKRVPTGIINGYLTIRYFMDTDTDLMIPVPAGIRTVNKLSKLLKYLCVYIK